MVRARMKCTANNKHDWGNQVRLECVYSDDPNDPNKSFAAATPCGHVEMTISNPAASDAFEVGKFYLIDFTSAE